MLIRDRQSAAAAIEIIIHQGEGLQDVRWADPGHQELTHYYKLQRIAEGRSRIGPVRATLTNPRTADLPPSLRPVSDLFNGLYRYLYLTMADLFDGRSRQAPLVGRLYRLMTGLMRPLGRYLMEQPVGDGFLAGPTFEHRDLGTEPAAELRRPGVPEK